MHERSREVRLVIIQRGRNEERMKRRREGGERAVI